MSISIHFILSGFIQDDIQKKQSKLETDLEGFSDKIIDSLNGMEITFFDNINDVDSYIAKQIRNANTSVYALNSWQDFTKARNKFRNDTKYKKLAIELNESIQFFCSQKKSNEYKEIFTFDFSKPHSKRYDKMLIRISYDGYSCSYYDKQSRKKFPKVQCVIIDEEEIIFVSSAYDKYLCSVKNKNIAQIFCDYFHQAWELSTKIKEDGKVNEDVLEKIKSKYQNCKDDLKPEQTQPIKNPNLPPANTQMK